MTRRGARAAAALACAAALGATGPAAARAAAGAAPAAETCAAYDSVLADVVRPGGVDYARLRARDRATLARALATFARTSADSLAGDARTAFEINLYNATLLEAVCERWAPGSAWTPAADSFAVFRAPLVRTPSGATSLDALERAIRARAHDPRVHVGLHCGARSCPPLLQLGYRGASLRTRLEANLAAFLRDRARNQVDPGTRAMKLSRIFDWYAADFGGASALPGFVASRLGLPARGWTVSFLDYDWSLDLAPGGGAGGP